MNQLVRNKKLCQALKIEYRNFCRLFNTTFEDARKRVLLKAIGKLCKNSEMNIEVVWDKSDSDRSNYYSKSPSIKKQPKIPNCRENYEDKRQ